MTRWVCSSRLPRCCNRPPSSSGGCPPRNTRSPHASARGKGSAAGHRHCEGCRARSRGVDPPIAHPQIRSPDEATSEEVGNALKTGASSVEAGPEPLDHLLPGRDGPVAAIPGIELRQLFHLSARRTQLATQALQTFRGCLCIRGAHPKMVAAAHCMREGIGKRGGVGNGEALARRRATVRPDARHRLDLHHHPRQRQAGQRNESEHRPSPRRHPSHLFQVTPDIRHESALASRGRGVVGDEAHHLSQARTELRQHPFDVPDDHFGLRRKIPDALRLPGRILVDLPPQEGESAAAHSVLEREVPVPVPVALGPGVSAWVHGESSLDVLSRVDFHS